MRSPDHGQSLYPIKLTLRLFELPSLPNIELAPNNCNNVKLLLKAIPLAEGRRLMQHNYFRNSFINFHLFCCIFTYTTFIDIEYSNECILLISCYWSFIKCAASKLNAEWKKREKKWNNCIKNKLHHCFLDWMRLLYCEIKISLCSSFGHKKPIESTKKPYNLWNNIICSIKIDVEFIWLFFS